VDADEREKTGEAPVMAAVCGLFCPACTFYIGTLDG